VALPAPRHQFTVADYHRMGEAGIFDGQRVELIEGEIIDMSPIGRKHNVCVDRLAAHFIRGLGDRVVARVQGSVRLNDLSEPQPDLALLRGRKDFYAGLDAGPEDVLLMVEVSDTTLAYDLEMKVPLYARNGVPEVRVVDISDERVIVHRDPGPDDHREVFELRGADPLSPLALPDFSLTADDIVGGLG
jgi:Uma2 family endonuclease